MIDLGKLSAVIVGLWSMASSMFDGCFCKLGCLFIWAKVEEERRVEEEVEEEEEADI